MRAGIDLLRVYYRMVCCVGLAAIAPGCTSELPGPIECEEMAFRLIGRNRKEVNVSPAAQRLVARLVHGCLTAPFDEETLRCVAQSRNLPRCMEQLAHREPQRRATLQSLLESVSQ